MNHRGVTNGAPVDRRHTTWALELRKLGYDPVLLGCKMPARARAPSAVVQSRQADHSRCVSCRW